jgi:hypothetical protein
MTKKQLKPVHSRRSPIGGISEADESKPESTSAGSWSPASTNQ